MDNWLYSIEPRPDRLLETDEKSQHTALRDSKVGKGMTEVRIHMLSTFDGPGAFESNGYSETFWVKFKFVLALINYILGDTVMSARLPEKKRKRMV